MRKRKVKARNFTQGKELISALFIFGEEYRVNKMKEKNHGQSMMLIC